MKKQIDTAVIIVNWNGEKLLFDCFDSLRGQSYQNFKIVFVDNGSEDSSVEFVRKNFLDKDLLKIEIIELSENTGFAKGNNIGISKALEDKNVQNIVLLNNDTKVEDDFLERLVSTTKDEALNNKYEKVGALAPKILLSDQKTVGNKQEEIKKWQSLDSEQDNIIDSVGARVGRDGRGYSIGHGEKDEGQYNEVREVFGFCGGAVLLRLEMLEDVAGSQNSAKVQPLQKCEGWTFVEYQEYFDDNFFAYYEDADLSCRMRLRGWQTITVPSAVVHHFHSATTDEMPSSFKAYYLNRNRFLMMFKNFPGKILWKGLTLVPRSYFNRKQETVGRIQETSKFQKTKDTLCRWKSGKQMVIKKIKMIGVMIKVCGSGIFNLPKLIWQRRQIQKNRLIDIDDFERWLV